MKTAGIIYHVLNRGVDKRKIFMEERDYVRFVHNLYIFNDKEPVSDTLYTLKNSMDIGRPYMREHRERKLLVDILAFVLMPNHYHLLLMPHSDMALPLFMKKLNMGYAKYFNEKYERGGALFQGRYKAIPILRDAHFIHIPYYIHLNPLDLSFPEWRERRLRNHKKAWEFLASYRWSSHLDYTGRKNFPSITNRKLLNEYFGGPKSYEKEIFDWLQEFDNTDKDLKLLLLE